MQIERQRSPRDAAAATKRGRSSRARSGSTCPPGRTVHCTPSHPAAASRSQSSSGPRATGGWNILEKTWYSVVPFMAKERGPHSSRTTSRPSYSGGTWPWVEPWTQRMRLLPGWMAFQSRAMPIGGQV